MPDYVFHGEGMVPGRMGGIVGPARRVLRRLQRPWFDRQVEILYELRAALDEDAGRIATAEAHVAELRRQVSELRVRLEADEARSWDQTAIARRLAALEDATAGLAPTPPPVT